jgi:hypothetical protein
MNNVSGNAVHLAAILRVIGMQIEEAYHQLRRASCTLLFPTLHSLSSG